MWSSLRGKHLSFKKQSPLAWLFLSVLLCANLATFTFLWSVINRHGFASEPNFLPKSSPSPQLFWPKPAFTPQATPTATQVVVYVSTATRTPSPTLTHSPTPTNTPSPTKVVLPTKLPPTKELNHVVIISIDGLRPDALLQAYTPTLEKLLGKGAYSPRAQTVSMSVTLPSHASMLSGMVPEKHGIFWNQPYIGWPGMNGPTLFNVAHDEGLSTAMVFGKQKLHYLVLPNSVDKLFGANTHDLDVKNQAIKFIKEGLPNVLFIHFPDTDIVGHKYGWMSENQFQSITYVDGLIGEIVTELENGGYLNRTLLIITADHGGRDFTHGDDSPLDRTIPWLAVGPKIPQGITLSGQINTYDTAATAAYALKLPIPEKWDGQPVLQIFPK